MADGSRHPARRHTGIVPPTSRLRVDVDSLVEQTDLGAVIAGASGGLATDALDEVRSQAVGLDQFIDRWVARLLRRKNSGPLAPPGLLDAEATP